MREGKNTTHDDTCTFSDVVIVPLRGLAEQLELPIHERDTFTGWNVSLSLAHRLLAQYD